ncbi:DUF5682 family protein [Dictyobacter kobayashii]|uniref:Uncharacterized protein n=1 Tax=Dictyobacter kobayashii TaxID=2014872 RepID=A0A402ANJ9_9CHLR|nr:DUF5682 family protein [Dictyobacter kobayashii]GCE20599.1 hypothetical protein KDK_43990 [Dictyobacter kobayashii]
MSSIHVFGIRHHGPGCARSLRAALEKLKPDILLIEGPPDAQEVLPFMEQAKMKPPVALLIYAPEQPKKAVYYPFTQFSPEWQALKYAQKAEIPARFMDLPQSIQLARLEEGEDAEANEPGRPTARNKAKKALRQNSTATVVAPETDEQTLLQEDPLTLLAQAAGYTDHELWWERQIEQRQNVVDLFEGILEAMTALRADARAPKAEEAQREAYMRQTIRAAQKENYQRIAVICGAWHAPVLTNPGPAQEDTELLKGLTQIKVTTTWIPWTYSRLSSRSGYGAGMEAPGWYAHLWTAPKQLTTRWITRAAHLLREHGLDASSASVIEAVRLTESLAAMRDLTQPGLAEHNEAIMTVLCHGDMAPMQLIRDQLEVGDKLGEVPKEAPAVPLQHDVEYWQQRLRLKPSTEKTKLELDLRKDTDRARSQLLHRLQLLSIPWGKQVRVSGKAGTFHEHWQLQWKVNFAVAIIEANIWGNTVATAATSYVTASASKQTELPALTELLQRVILAELPAATDQLLAILQERAALSTDVRHLMDALPPLARVARYGDVRQTRAERILPIIDGLFERSLIGLPGACFSLDDDAALAMLKSIDNVQDSIQLLDNPQQRQVWQERLKTLAERDNIHGLIRGRCCRLLLDQQALTEAEMQRLIQLALSPAVPLTQAAAWIEGVIRGSGLLILHQDDLWRALDQWLSVLSSDNFIQLLPILRRAFASFQAPERRHMGEKIKRLHQPVQNRVSTRGQNEQVALDYAHAAHVLPVLAQLMGVKNGN